MQFRSLSRPTLLCAALAAAGLSWCAVAPGLRAADTDTTVDLNAVPANSDADQLHLEVTLTRTNNDPLYLKMPGPLNDLLLKLAIKNTADPMQATSAGAPPPSSDFDFGTPMVLKFKDGKTLDDLLQPGVKPEDVLEIQPGHRIEGVQTPLLTVAGAGGTSGAQDAVNNYTNPDGTHTIPTYTSYDNLTKDVAAATTESDLLAAVKKFAADTGLTFVPLGQNMAERADLITTLPDPQLGPDSRLEIYVYRKTTAAEQAAFKANHPDKTPPTMLLVPRVNRNVFAADQSTSATEVIDSGNSLDADIATKDPFTVDVGHNFEFVQEGDYVVVASILGHRAVMSNQLEFSVLPYWVTNMTLDKLDAWINEKRSLGPFPYNRMVYLVDGTDGFRELVYSKRYANGKLVHHEFFRLGRVFPGNEKDIAVTVVNDKVLKVDFTESHGHKVSATIDFSYSSPSTSVTLSN
ncbi:MAG: hypothetical protein ACREJ2_01535 [Planctomycetota bacterium]